MRPVALVLFLLSLAPAVPAGELTLGLIPEQNVFRQMERYRPIGQYLERRTGLKIRFTILSRYGNIIDRFLEDELDGAFWGSFTGALAMEKIGVEPIARPVWEDGTSTYCGYVFVRRGSGISSVAEMRGRSVVFVDRATTAGYVFPVAYFREHGVADLAAYFAEHHFAGSHDAAIAAVLGGRADVGCAKDTIYRQVAGKDPRVARDLVILARSEDVPSNGLGLRRELPSAVRESVRQALVAMEDDPEGRVVLAGFGAREFVATTREDYRPVFELARKAGIDLTRYDYRNQ